jgi:hypothetical protein
VAARSYAIEIVNLTGLELSKNEAKLQHGVWSGDGDNTPPDRIPSAPTSGHDAYFGSESQGFATGTQGSVVYGSSAGDFTVDWDNPYVGSDSSSASCPPGYDKSKSDSGGDNATLKVVFYPSA